jgi:hypothetical protein
MDARGADTPDAGETGGQAGGGQYAPARQVRRDERGGVSAMDEAQFQMTLSKEVFKIIARDVGSADSRFRKTPNALEEFDVEYLTNEEAELLLALEGEKSLSRISQELGWSPLNVARVVFGLMTMDLVDRLDDDEV